MQTHYYQTHHSKKALQLTIARPVVANYSEVSDSIQVKAHEYLSGNGDLADAVKSN